MILFAQAEPAALIWQLIVLCAIGAAVAVWLIVVLRLQLGHPVLPRQPRRPVPWRGIDLLAVLVVFMVTGSAISRLLLASLDSQIAQPRSIWNVEETTTSHQVAQLMAEGNAWILLMCGISAVIVAPIAEEFLFRVLLQGWLEAVERRMRPFMPILGRLVAVGPIFLSSLLFARLHFRVDGPPQNIWVAVYLLLAMSMASVISMVLAIIFLRVFRGATAADFGWSTRLFLRDVRLGVLAFVGLAPAIYGLNMILMLLLPKWIAPDPFSLFFLAIVLGTIYYRTHRLVPSVALHMSLNFTSLAAAWLILR